MIVGAKPRRDACADLQLAAADSHPDEAELRLVMQRNDQQFFRAALRILGNREDAEDAVQSAYLSAIAAIGSFAGRSTLSTWLTRIVINAALAQVRMRRRRRAWLHDDPASLLECYSEHLMRGSVTASPERALACRQIKQLIDDAIDQLPVLFRTVFVLRQIEEREVGEVALALGINPATVKTRHLRARKRLQRVLAPTFGSGLAGIFLFAGEAHEQAAGRLPGTSRQGAWNETDGRTA